MNAVHKALFEIPGKNCFHTIGHIRFLCGLGIDKTRREAEALVKAGVVKRLKMPLGRSRIAYVYGCACLPVESNVLAMRKNAKLGSVPLLIKATNLHSDFYASKELLPEWLR